MKKSSIAFAILLLLIVSVRMLQSQQGAYATLVQQTATQFNVATKVADCNVAVNTVCTATATPSGGNYVYVVAVDMAVCSSNTTGTLQTNVTWTTTNLTGAPIIWHYSNPAAVNLCLYKTVMFENAIKSTTPGTAVTLVSPAGAAQEAYNANIYWYEAP